MVNQIPPVQTYVSEGYNCVMIGSNPKKICDFTYVVRRHAIDIETEAHKYILDCKTIVDEKSFYLILDRNHLNSPQSFCKVSYIKVAKVNFLVNFLDFT